MNILNYKQNNIIAFPKCGSTNLIKICTDIPAFKYHNHSYKHNNCSIYKKIHSCAGTAFKFHKQNPTIIIYRYPHERFVSFYYGNNYVIPKNLSFENFVNSVLENPKSVKGFIHHCSPISQLLTVRNKDLYNTKNKFFVHLSELNDFWLKKFNIDISKLKIRNKTKSSSYNFDKKLLHKIKNHKSYKNDYLIESNFLT